MTNYWSNVITGKPVLLGYKMLSLGSLCCSNYKVSENAVTRKPELLSKLISKCHKLLCINVETSMLVL